MNFPNLFRSFITNVQYPLMVVWKASECVIRTRVVFSYHLDHNS
jgi:hypothetical protein